MINITLVRNTHNIGDQDAVVLICSSSTSANKSNFLSIASSVIAIGAGHALAAAQAGQLAIDIKRTIDGATRPVGPS